MYKIGFLVCALVRENWPPLAKPLGRQLIFNRFARKFQPALCQEWRIKIFHPVLNRHCNGQLCALDPDPGKTHGGDFCVRKIAFGLTLRKNPETQTGRTNSRQRGHRERLRSGPLITPGASAEAWGKSHPQKSLISWPVL